MTPALSGARWSLLPEGPLVVAVSAGLDSMVLLHQLRFTSTAARELHVVHVDHGMRPDSGLDGEWLRGVCRSWGIPLHIHGLEPAPSSEAEAREGRYGVLHRVLADTGSAAIVTAHHADDQAETVLFRALRGTGLRGLRGMDPVSGSIVRPLLEVWRADLEAHAARWRVPWREDSTNESLEFARNAIRHVLMPEAEDRVAAGARRSLVRLGVNAAQAHVELAAFDDLLFSPLVVDGPGAQGSRLDVSEEEALSLPEPLQRRLVRWSSERVGVTLSAEGTQRAWTALVELQRGRGVDAEGGLRVERGASSWIFLRGTPGTDTSRDAEPAVVITGADSGSGTLALANRSLRIAWSLSPSEDGTEVPCPKDGYPLRVRGWQPGDRIRLPYGTKSVAKLLAEAGVSALDRPSVPLVVDAHNRVLWVPGHAAAHAAADSGPSLQRLFISCTPNQE